MILACIITALITALAVALWVYRKMRRKVDYMLDALEDRELNFRFDEKVVIGRGFHKTLNRLRRIFDRERQEIVEQSDFLAKCLTMCRQASWSLTIVGSAIATRPLCLFSDLLRSAISDS